MIKFDCEKFIHLCVCKLKDEADNVINNYNNRIGENEIFSINLNCKYYTTVSIKDIKCNEY